jgi:hypothetical protein
MACHIGTRLKRLKARDGKKEEHGGDPELPLPDDSGTRKRQQRGGGENDMRTGDEYEWVERGGPQAMPRPKRRKLEGKRKVREECHKNARKEFAREYTHILSFVLPHIGYADSMQYEKIKTERRAAL